MSEKKKYRIGINKFGAIVKTGRPSDVPESDCQGCAYKGMYLASACEPCGYAGTPKSGEHYATTTEEGRELYI